MSRPRSYQTEAVIIKKTKLGEADSILTLYTPHLGKIQGFAKSLRKSKSKMAGHLELLTYSQVSLARGKNIDTIIGSQTINSFLPLKSDLELVSYALYIIELVNQFTAENVEDYPLFRLLLETLERLCHCPNSELAVRYFELHLLSEVGYRPQLGQCVLCRQPLKPEKSYFCPGAGGVVCPGCGYSQSFSYPLSIDGLKTLRLLQDGDGAIPGNLNISSTLSLEIERVTQNYIRYLLDKDVKSAAWLATIKRQNC